MFFSATLLIHALSLWELGFWVGAWGQVTNNLPPCAAGCVTTAARAAGCSVDDLRCLCNSEGFLSSVERCASEACTGNDQAAAALAFARLCNVFTPIPSGPAGPSPSSSGTAITTFTTTLSVPASTITVISTLQPSVTLVPPPPISSFSSTTLSNPTSSQSQSTQTITSITSIPLPTTTIPTGGPSTSTSVVFISTGSPQPLPTTRVNAATSLELGVMTVTQSMIGLALAFMLFS